MDIRLQEELREGAARDESRGNEQQIPYQQFSVAEVFVYENYLCGNAGGLAVEDRRHLAHPVGRIATLAADARAREPARCTLAEPLRVRRAGTAPDSCDRLVYAAVNYLVAPDHVDDALRAADRRRDAVAGTVDVDDPSVGRERVGGKKE